MISKLILIVAIITCLLACEKSDTNVLVNTTPITNPVPAQHPGTPAAILDLSPFKLFLPVNSSGLEQAGTECISKTSTLLTGGYSSKYFYVSADSGVTFWCPIDGATTSPGVGSDHPRTELSETYLWDMNSTSSSTLNAVVSVNQYPSATNDIIIGQIHGGGTTYSSAPFVMLHAKAGNIVAYVKGYPSGNAGTQSATLLQNVPLGAKVSYSISTDSANIYFRTSCTSTTGTGSWTVPIPAAWTGVTVHFSAGDYVQAVGSDSTDGGKVTFYSLKVFH